MREFKFGVGDTVRVAKAGTKYLEGLVGNEYKVEKLFTQGVNNMYYLGTGIGNMYEEELVLVSMNEENKSVNALNKKEKDFVSIANEIGEFTQMKNEAYGSSVDATQKIMEALMERYLNVETDKYEFPRSLLKHMLLQVRIMDKQNRLFSNPDGDKLGESPYRDLTGYGLIGIEMDERNS